MLVDVSKVSQVCQRLIESAADIFGPQCHDLFGDDASPPAVEEGEETGPLTPDYDSATSDNTGKFIIIFNICKVA